MKVDINIVSSRICFDLWYWMRVEMIVVKVDRHFRIRSLHIELDGLDPAQPTDFSD